MITGLFTTYAIDDEQPVFASGDVDVMCSKRRKLCRIAYLSAKKRHSSSSGYKATYPQQEGLVVSNVKDLDFFSHRPTK